MSLFGGDAIVISSASSSDDESLPERTSSPQNAQAPPSPIYVPDVDNSDDEDFQPSSPDAEAAPPERPRIKPQSWRRYTAADRELAGALDDIESADLAAHLYNAHHLKRRLRRPVQQLEAIKDWQSKDSWLRKGAELQYEDPLTGDLETELVPSKLWTAWPLPPKRLAHMNKKFIVAREKDSQDGWYIGGSTGQDTGEVMRDEVLALLLRTAKENWMARPTDPKCTSKNEPKVIVAISDDEPEVISISASSSDSDSDTEMEDRETIDLTDDTRNKKGAKKTQGFNSSFSSSETDGEQIARRVEDLEINTDDGPATRTTDQDSESDGASLPKTNRASSRTQQPTTAATFLADDDEARRILEPSINSLLSSLDKLALAVRRNRLNHVGDRAHRSRSVSDNLTDGETPAPRSRASSRPRSRGQLRKKSSQPPTAKKPTKKRSKPRQEAPTSDDSGSASDYGADHESDEEEQPSSSEQPRKRRARSISSNSSRSSNASNKSAFNSGVGLMDWSEVLGLAAVSGWNERVVARAAQRCASLFGEKMSFRQFDERLAAKSTPEAVQYTPSTIPAPDEMDLDEASSPPKRPYFQPGTLRCPHPDCPGSLKEFSGTNRLTEHVRRKHGYDPRTNDSDNEERTVGGVHVDGFLQPVWAKAGWLGHGRSKSEGLDLGPGIPKRKRRKVDSRPTSTVTSAYNTQDEQEDAGEERATSQVVEEIPARMKLQPYKACTSCVRRKKPCDGGRPCGRCRAMGEEGTCKDQVQKAQKPKACSNCKRRKLGCDYNRPCARCEDRGEEETCEYPA